MMKKTIVRWGVVGPGNIARKFAAALAGTPGGRLDAVAARSLERGRVFAAENGVERIYANASELAADPEIDAVYVATPHPFHYACALAALEGGKAVLCEKPITLNASELTRLIAAARKHRVFLMEAMWTRFLPVSARVREWVGSGAIGDLRMISADFCFSNEFNPDSRLFSPELGGGALLDVGIYPLAYAQMLAGEPESVRGGTFPAPTGVDGCDAMLLQYPAGVFALLSCAVNTFAANDARIRGAAGEIAVPEFWSAETATLLRSGASEPETFSCPHRINGYEYEIEEVHRCLGAGVLESPLMPLADSLALQRIMDKLRADWKVSYPHERV